METQFQILYRNNHFKPLDLFDNVSNNMDIFTNDVDNETKNIVHVLWT